MTERIKRPEVSPEIERLAVEYVQWEDKTVEARWEQGRIVDEAIKREGKSLRAFASRVGRAPSYLGEWRLLFKRYPDKATLVSGVSAKAHHRAAQVHKGAECRVCDPVCPGAPAWLRTYAEERNGVVKVDELLAELERAGATAESEVDRATAHLLKPDTDATKVASTLRRIVTERPEVLKEVEALKGAEIAPKDIQAALKVPEVAKEVAKDRKVEDAFNAAQEEVAKERQRAMGMRPAPRQPDMTRRRDFFDAKAALLDAVLKLKAAKRKLSDFAATEAEAEDLTTTADKAIAYAEAIKAQLAGDDLDEQLRQLIEAGTE